MPKWMSFALAVVLLAVMAACMPGSGNPTKTGNFSNRGVAGYGAAAGTYTITKLGTEIKTELKLTGLKANTQYVAHYHALGTASTTPCDSQGPIKTDLGTVTSDASGAATFTNTTSAANIVDLGVYINVHEAANISVVPLCADVSALSF
jgi:hypothetical protein